MQKKEYKGTDIYGFCDEIFPYFRSLTGEGVRQTLTAIDRYISQEGGPHLTVYEVPSGTKSFDWTVPKEWRINEAYIENEKGNHVIDIKSNNLHVLGYSIGVDRWVELDELKEYIYTQPDQPDVIPYVTSYYKERFGFCMSQNQLETLPSGKYHMYIDSQLFDGVLNYADVIIPGKSDEEVMFSTYLCHPSMADDECSGLALQSELVRYVASLENRRYTYRFVFIPETIGSLTYMSQMDRWKCLKKKLVAGFVLACVGDDRGYGCVKTKYENTLSDKVITNVLQFHTDGQYKSCSFLKRGSDEQQYGGSNLELPVVAFFRSKYGEFPEYHTSADNMDFVNPSGFQGSYDVMTQIINSLENNFYYKTNTFGDPQLGPRGLYPSISHKGMYDELMSMMNFIAYADGRNDLIDISNIIGVPIDKLIDIIKRLMKFDLLSINDNPND